MSIKEGDLVVIKDREDGVAYIVKDIINIGANKHVAVIDGVGLVSVYRLELFIEDGYEDEEL